MAIGIPENPIEEASEAAEAEATAASVLRRLVIQTVTLVVAATAEAVDEAAVILDAAAEEVSDEAASEAIPAVAEAAMTSEAEEALLADEAALAVAARGLYFTKYDFY